MRYKTLFRVLQKIIGLFLVVTAAGELLSGLGLALYYVDMLSLGGPGVGSTWVMAAAQVIAPIAKFLLGLYLFFGAKWIANLAIPGNRPYCHECGYDLTHTASGRCPECGTVNERENSGSDPVKPPPLTIGDCASNAQE